MSQLDTLLARSRSPGRFLERRKFTLSREKAIETQRAFALRHPSQYVLELVQAAVFAGGTYLAVDTRPHGLLMAWVGGAPLTEDELEHLFDYLFADRGNPRWRHLVQLAVGVNALGQRTPRNLRIESGDGSRSVRLDLDASGTARLGAGEEPIAGTYVYAEFRRGWFGRAFDHRSTDEQALVEERCLYSPVPILLNGRAPFGHHGSRHIEIFGARKQVHFDADDRRGVVALHASDHAPSGFRVVVGGVWVTTAPLEHLARRPLVGVICDDALRKTADHADIVRDDGFLEMLHAVQPYATEVMRSVEGPRYRPPELPPRPSGPGGSHQIRAEFLPTRLPSLPPRPPVDTTEAFAPWETPLAHDAASEATATPDPLFWCVEADVDALISAADPLRFPYRVLVMTPGQAVTLQTRCPSVPVHRLQGRTDVEFVRRVLERQTAVREHRVGLDGARGSVRIRLHLDHRLPDWGVDDGVPWAAVRDDRTVLLGAIGHGEVRVCASSLQEALPARWPTSIRVHLPHVSLVLELPEGAALGPEILDDRLLARVLDEALSLAMPNGEAPHRGLSCALLGLVARPWLPTGLRQPARAALPPGWPDTLGQVPLLSTTEGPMSLATFLDLLGTERTLAVPSVDTLGAVDDLEWRFGYGHLTHPSLDAPLFGVGREKGRWRWLDAPPAWTSPALSQVIWVAATFAPRPCEPEWVREAACAPEIVAMRRSDIRGEDWEDGFECLYLGLVRMDEEDTWVAPPMPGGVRRARGMGRLALLHLAHALGRLDGPIRAPSDGSARRSLRQIRGDPRTRIVASEGVEVAGPWTFAVTCDEGVAMSGDTPLTPWFTESPEIWRSLVDTPETDWLIRQAVREGGVWGWLGLRRRYSRGSGVLLRTRGRWCALPEVDRVVPCHGLLCSGDDAPTPAQQRLVQLAGLRMFLELSQRLSTGREAPEWVESARLHGFAFAERAWGRGRRTGVTLAFARAIDVYDSDGRVWGSLERWLDAPPTQRPPRPHALAAPFTEAPADATTSLVGLDLAAIQARLTSAFQPMGLEVRVAWGSDAAVEIADDRSHGAQVLVLVGLDHPLGRAVRSSVRAQEIVLLEAARQVTVWGMSRGLSLDLLTVQQALLAQRLGR